MAELLKPVLRPSRRASVIKEASVAATSPRDAAPSTNPDQTQNTLRVTPLLELHDGKLAQMAIDGNADAYAELVGRYQHAVRNLARSMIRDFQHAEDLAQEAFIKAFNSLNALKEPDKFGPWIFTILRHTVLDYLRGNRDNVSLETLLEDGFEPQGRVEGEAAEATIEAHEEEQRTLAALASLRDDYREVIILKHVEKLPYKEIATRLNMSVSAVGEKLSRVRGLLRRRLEKQTIKKAPGSDTPPASPLVREGKR
jgi:RNA polymerase sigma-70 factor, ECF subfamily